MHIVVPFPLTAETVHNHDAETVAKAEDPVGSAPKAFEAHGVESHVTDQCKLLGIIVGRVAHEDVVHPPGTTDEHGAAIEQEGTVPVFVKNGIDLTNAKRYDMVSQRVSL